MSSFKPNVEECLALQELPSYEFISSLVKNTCTVLANESVSYRPANCVGQPGSLLKLYEEDKRCLPVVIIPDIHARPDFIKNILDCALPKLKL